jgi:UDPglucose 6-dehydrogenase
VWGVDSNLDAVGAVNDRKTLIQEPGLSEKLGGLPYHRQPTGGLVATTDLRVASKQSEVTFIIVPTPSQEDGSFDSRVVEEIAGRVNAATQRDHALAVCSTVSPGTMRRIKVENPECEVVYTPFLIALGSVLHDLANPDVRIIGADYGNRKAEFVAGILDSLGKAPSALLTLAAAEIAKLALNAYVVQKISFANTIAQACEEVGVDARPVLRTIGRDRRIGTSYLKPGGWAGGPCFPRDSDAIIHWLKSVNAPVGLPVAAQRVNQRQAARAVEWLRHYRRVAVLGLSYKPDTPVTEGSLGLAVAHELLALGRDIYAHDPVALIPFGLLPAATDVDAVLAADAVFVATAWPEYEGLDVGDKPTLDLWGIVKGTNVTVRGVG